MEVVRAAGGVPTGLFTAVALVAVTDEALLTGIMSSRPAYGMARDGLLPRFLGALTCVLLATQIEQGVWLRGLVVLAVGGVLGSVPVVRSHRGHDHP